MSFFSSIFCLNGANRVGVCHSNVVESEGRVWVEVGSCGSGRQKEGLKLRVAHLHPENPVIAPALQAYRLKHGSQSVDLSEDKVSLESEEDFWFNHWQGPDICPEPSSQAISAVQRASFRCNTCNKKVASSEPASSMALEEPAESPVLAHLPSTRRPRLKINSASSNISPLRATQQPPFMLGSTLESDTSSDNHQLSGRLSSSEEHLSAVERVLQHEMRTDSSLFLADDEPDWGDRTDGGGTAASVAVTQGAVLPDVGSPWRSRSCPCSPKTAARTLQKHPELKGSSQRQSVHYHSNKFSLSGSLLAMHRQASSSLRSNASKNSSLHNSLVLRKRRSYCSIDEEDGSSILSEEEMSEEASNHGNNFKQPIQVSHSLPALKLSRIAMSHHNEEPVAEEESPSVQWHLELSEGPSDANAPDEEVCIPSIDHFYLPDLIPNARDCRSVMLNETPERLCATPVGMRDGFINLGFDGQSESSDAHDEVHHYNAFPTPSDDGRDEEGKVPSPIHGMSIGYLKSPDQHAQGFDVSVLTSFQSTSPVDDTPSSNDINTLSSTTLSNELSDSRSSCGSSIMMQSSITSAASTAPCSPSALRIRVMDGPTLSSLQQRPSAGLPLNLEGRSAAQLKPKKTLLVQGSKLDTSITQNEILPTNNSLALQNESLKSNSLIAPPDVFKINNSTGATNELTRNTLKRADSTAHADLEQQQQIQQFQQLLMGTQKQLSAAESGKKGASCNTFPRSGQFVRKEGFQPPLPPPPPQDIEEEVGANLTEARALVYWWKQAQEFEADNGTDGEYCSRRGECAAKRLPLLMFIHGVGGSSDDWHHQLWYFVSAGYEVVAPDLLGHGLSSAPDSAACYRFPRLLEQLRLLYDLFVPKGRKCVLVGHGYGCALAAALLRYRPSSAPLLVLASCGGPAPLMPPPPAVSTVVW
ncbi:uncharacterized protein LOC108680180 isoform X2 [Hyalella azteca]|uniref:acylglycerol lipase n=1 Tax=Hyalella azteca TaxID=294128 RepID=A0A979FRB4_HYAAZ|nr:uncharacterized protein LOC108680180 isoform X2 [Hyalella azteca]